MTRKPLLRPWFEAPEQPPAAPRLRIRPGLTATGLGLAIIRSAGWYAFAGSLLLVCYNVAAMLQPVVIGRTIDRGIGPVVAGEPWRDAVGGFLGWGGVIVALFVVMNLGFRFGGRLGWYAVQRARYELSDRVLSRVLDTHGVTGPGLLPGSVLSVVTLDVQRACQATYVAVYPVGELVALVVAGVSLFLIHPALGFAVLVGAPLLLGVMALLARPLMERSEAEQEGVADATAAATDIVSGYRVIAGIHAQGAAAARYRGISRTALDGTVAARTALSVFEGINTTLTGLFSAAVAVGAAALAFTGRISIGELIAAAGIAQVLLGPLQSLVGEAGATWAMAMASAGRVMEFLDRPGHLDPARGRIPGDGTSTVLAADALPLPHGRLDLDIRPGEFVVIDVDGPDGQALCDALALREPRPAHGPRLADGIRYRGVPLTELDPDLFRAHLLVAPRQAELFEGTVLGNVLSAVEGDAAEFRARAALAVAHCESLKDELPEGYATLVGERGRMLSGGQRQRVALARAIAARPPVLLLHEPTNAVDSVSEATIAARVRDARQGLTTLVISSSAAFRSVADRIVRPGATVGGRS